VENGHNYGKVADCYMTDVNGDEHITLDLR
jgi:hypothetical protein